MRFSSCRVVAPRRHLSFSSPGSRLFPSLFARESNKFSRLSAPSVISFSSPFPPSFIFSTFPGGTPRHSTCTSRAFLLFWIISLILWLLPLAIRKGYGRRVDSHVFEKPLQATFCFNQAWPPGRPLSRVTPPYRFFLYVHSLLFFFPLCLPGFLLCDLLPPIFRPVVVENFPFLSVRAYVSLHSFFYPVKPYLRFFEHSLVILRLRDHFTIYPPAPSPESLRSGFSA